MSALAERKVEEMDSLTVAVATAGSLLLSADALAAWRRAHGAPGSDAPMDGQTLGLILGRFPGAIKVK